MEQSHGTKNIHRSKLHLQHTTWTTKFSQLLLLKVCESFNFGQIKKLEVYFGLFESPFTFIEKKRPIKYCLCIANLISYMLVFNLMGQDVNLARLVEFPPIFAVDTKIIFRYDFVAPLTKIMFLSLSVWETIINIVQS